MIVVETISPLETPVVDMPVATIITEEEKIFLDSLVEIFIQNLD
jgi:hypothetical protein